jgi:hypothetical protein
MSMVIKIVEYYGRSSQNKIEKGNETSFFFSELDGCPFNIELLQTKYNNLCNSNLNVASM